MDIDHFKRINDEFGHLGGDKALLYFARTMRRTIRTGDQAFRYGGEEFALLLPKSRTNEAFLVATRIQRALHERPVSLVEGHTAIVQFSAGVASADASNDFRADDLIARADAALYRAKNNGRNRVELADSMTEGTRAFKNLPVSAALRHSRTCPRRARSSPTLVDKARTHPEPDTKPLRSVGYLGSTTAGVVFERTLRAVILPGFEACAVDLGPTRVHIAERGWL